MMLRLTSQTDNTVRRREMGTDTSKAEAELWARCKRGRAVDLACVNDAGRRVWGIWGIRAIWVSGWVERSEWRPAGPGWANCQRASADCY